MRNLTFGGTIVVLAFLSVSAFAADTELPDAAKKAFQDKYKDVKSYKVKSENEKGKTLYEVKFKDADGVENEVELTADGSKLKVEDDEDDEKDEKK